MGKKREETKSRGEVKEGAKGKIKKGKKNVSKGVKKNKKTKLKATQPKLAGFVVEDVEDTNHQDFSDDKEDEVEFAMEVEKNESDEEFEENFEPILEENVDESEIDEGDEHLKEEDEGVVPTILQESGSHLTKKDPHESRRQLRPEEVAQIEDYQQNSTFLFNIQASELLAEHKAPSPLLQEVDDIVNRIKSHVLSIPTSSSDSAKVLSLFKSNAAAAPLLELLSSSPPPPDPISFSFHPPKEVIRLDWPSHYLDSEKHSHSGRYRMDVTLALPIPAACWVKKDLSHFQYFQKRLFFLSHIASSIQSTSSLVSSSSHWTFSWHHFRGNAMKPYCRISIPLSLSQSKKKKKDGPSSSSHFLVVHLVPSVSLSSLHLKSSHRLYTEKGRAGIYCNSSILEDLYITKHSQYVLSVIGSLSHNAQHALVLLRLWLSTAFHVEERESHVSVCGDFDKMFVDILFSAMKAKGIFSSEMSLFQIFRRTLSFLASLEKDEKVLIFIFVISLEHSCFLFDTFYTLLN
jgi:hypothetical protein